jgi:hypothetical protein
MHEEEKRGPRPSLTLVDDPEFRQAAPDAQLSDVATP